MELTPQDTTNIETSSAIEGITNMVGSAMPVATDATMEDLISLNANMTGGVTMNPQGIPNIDGAAAAAFAQQQMGPQPQQVVQHQQQPIDSAALAREVNNRVAQILNNPQMMQQLQNQANQGNNDSGNSISMKSLALGAALGAAGVAIYNMNSSDDYEVVNNLIDLI